MQQGQLTRTHRGITDRKVVTSMWCSMQKEQTCTEACRQRYLAEEGLMCPLVRAIIGIMRNVAFICIKHMPPRVVHARHPDKLAKRLEQ